MQGLKEAALKAAIVLTPSYTAAFLTGKMVYVVPTLAAAGFFASSISLNNNLTVRQVDDDGGDDGPDGGDGHDGSGAASSAHDDG